uniref:DUF3338 domain-containing protein n=1 Tax=Gongylonema pulchrum TaxID=637853 RepID=A0A183E0S1_9BILA
LYRRLKGRKNELEEKLLAKLDELREVCVKEAEITGELPKEIYKTLMPGEEEPKIQRRVGTAFTLNEEVFKRPVDCDDRISMLETDVELHRKIVAAAERLAKDKTTNKSVRKKRQKDLIAATQKLRGLEFGLSQLRLSASKPDVSTSTQAASCSKEVWRNCSNYAAEPTSLGGRNGSGALITKSCPATPRGSFPDLLTSTDNERSEADDEEDDARRASAECMQRFPSTSSSACPNFPLNHHRSSYRKSTNGCCPDINEDGLLLASEPVCSRTLKRIPPPRPPQAPSARDFSWEKLANHGVENNHMPIYENVGYRSCASYKSSYRETNFPTLNDLNSCRTRVQHAFSDYDLPDPAANSATGKCQSRTNFSTVNTSEASRNIARYGTTVKQPSSKYRFGQESSRECVAATSSSTKEQRVMLQPNSEPSSSLCPDYSSKLGSSSFSKFRQNSPPVTGLLVNDGKAPLRYAVLPTSRSYNEGFATASLDRRAVKGRQTSCGSMGYHRVRPPQLGSSGGKTANGTPVHGAHSPMSALRFTTTFPVANGIANVEKSKPHASPDIHRYQRHSPLQQHGTLDHGTNHRPPPPAYPVAVRNGICSGSSPLEKVVPAETAARSDTLMNYYSDKTHGRGKNATVV